MTLADLRAHLVTCFESGVRIVGNVTAGEICVAIDVAADHLAAMTAARDEACDIAQGEALCETWSRSQCQRTLARIAELRKVGAP